MPKFKGKPQKFGILKFFAKVDKATPSVKDEDAQVDGTPSPTASSVESQDVENIAPMIPATPPVKRQTVETIESVVPAASPVDCEETRPIGTHYHDDIDDESNSICPFKPRDTYTCPFKTLGQCKKSQPFVDMRACAMHVKQTHPNRVIKSVEEDPLEDGTAKIPCQRRCGSMFTSYAAAITHTKMTKNCPVPVSSLYPQSCAWNALPGVTCIEINVNARAAATHAGSHVRDPRGPYQCHLCGQFWADIYLLASHITRCKGTGRTGFNRSCLRVELEFGTKQPTTILIARSSDGTPLSWYAGREFVEQGLPGFAAEKLADFKLDFGLENGDLPTCFHAGAAIQTRHLPAPKGNNATEATSTSEQTQLGRAWRFTNEIAADITKAAEAFPGCKPTLVSIGIDGFACQIDLILPFLKRMPQFTWIVRETEICHGMKEEVFLPRKSGIYYGIFDTLDIITAIEARLSEDKTTHKSRKVKDDVEHLLQVWETIQNHKDAVKEHRIGRSIGRNGDHRHVPRPDMKASKFNSFTAGS